MHQLFWVNQLRQDIEYALRLLWRDKGFTLVAALALALEIAATTSLITVVNAVLLRGLPLADPVVYVPRPSVAQTNRATLLVRARRGQAETTAVLSEEIRALDPDMPIFNIRTLETDLANQRWPLVVAGSTFGLFAGIGIALCAVGLFGLASYSLATRMREIALRLALGATTANVLWNLLGSVVAHVTLGLTLGILGAYGVGQLLRGLLVRTSPIDPQVLAGVGVVLLLAALTACIAPARRAMHVDPITILRSSVS